MLTGDTIAAVSTPPGPSRRALIRVSGPDAFAAITRLIAPDNAPPAFASRGARTVLVRLGEVRVPARLLVFPGPGSYTGENAAELILPGNPTLCERVLAALCEDEGVRRAAPGEFTARAYLNARLSLDQARGVGALVAARSEGERRAAAALLDGSLGRLLDAWLNELTTLLALVEAGIDFTEEEDVTAIEPEALAERAAGVSQEVKSSRAARTIETARPLVALVGPPSAGKSTLFNALLGRRRVVTHADPHTTRDAIVEPLDLSSPASPGLIVDLADLPGLDAADPYAADPHAADPDAAHRAAAIRCIERADLILLVDAEARFKPNAEAALAAPANAGTLRVRTKADLARPAPSVPGPEPPSPEPIDVCAVDGRGLGTLRDAIRDRLDTSASSDRARFAADQSSRLDEATAALDAVRADPNAPPEVLAEHLRVAIASLGSIRGRVTNEDVLAKVFSAFCVGK